MSDLITTLKAAIPIVSLALQGSIAALFTMFFVRRTTASSEIEKLKAGKFTEVIENLLETGSMTYFEFAKCKNFLQIAQLADKRLVAEEEIKKGGDVKKSKVADKETGTEMNFDWFLRFFEAASYITEEDMQCLWSDILSNKITKRTNFSLKTMEIFRNMSMEEVIMFTNALNCVIYSEYGDGSFFASEQRDEVELNNQYGIGISTLQKLAELGLVNSVPFEEEFSSLEEYWILHNNNICLKFAIKGNFTFSLSYYVLTQAGIQLQKVIGTEPDDNYLLNLGCLFKEKYHDSMTIAAYNLLRIDDETIEYDKEHDLLSTNQ